MANDASQFASQVRNLANTLVLEEISHKSKEVAADAIQTIVMGSPVGKPELWKHPPPKDYVPGRFRGNWHITFGSTDEETTENRDTNGAPTIAKCNAQLSPLDTNPFQKIFLCNSLPYAMALEHGHSTQAPGPAAIVGKAFALLSTKYTK